MDDLVVVADLVLRLDRVQKLVDDVLESRGQRLAHLRARVLGRGQPAHLHQPPQRDLVPLVVDDARFVQLLELLLRIVDQRRQHVALRLGHAVLEQDVYLLPDHARRVFQHVQKRLVLAVDVADEMLRPFGQTEDRFQIDDLRGDLRDRRILPRQKPQVLHVVERFLCHI